MYRNYLISFVPYNEDTKEYYVYCAREDIKEKAKELAIKFFDLEDLRKVDIYEYQKSLDLEEMRRGE